MASRKQTRQRKILQKSKRARQGKSYLLTLRRLGLLFTLAVVIVGVVVLYQFFSSGQARSIKDKVVQSAESCLVKAGFRIQNVIIDGRVRTSSDDVLKALQIKEKLPSYHYDIHHALEQVKKLTWVHGARIERRLPDTLYIKLVEKHPIGFWQEKSKTYLIDQEGNVIGRFPLKDFPGYIVATGPDAPKHLPQLIKTLAPYKAINAKTTGAIYVSGRRWDLILQNSLRVKLAEDNIVASLDKLDQILQDNKVQLQEVASIDLRASEKIYFYMHQKSLTGKQAKNRSKIA